MNCERYQILIDSYAEFELDVPVATQVGAHLASCATCDARHQAVLHERAVYREYLTEIDATPNLWAKVSRQTVERGPSRQRFGVGWLDILFPVARSASGAGLAVAAVVAVAVVSLTIVTLRHKDSAQKDPGNRISVDQSAKVNKPGIVPPDTAGTGPKQQIKVQSVASMAAVRKSKSEAPGSTMEAIRLAEKQYSAAIAFLSRDFQRRRTKLSPNVLANFEQTLTSLDDTIEATRRAAYDSPNDPVAVRYLMTAYARKVEALRQIVVL